MQEALQWAEWGEIIPDCQGLAEKVLEIVNGQERTRRNRTGIDPLSQTAAAHAVRPNTCMSAETYPQVVHILLMQVSGQLLTSHLKDRILLCVRVCMKQQARHWTRAQTAWRDVGKDV